MELLGAKDGGRLKEERVFELELAGGRRLHVPPQFDVEAFSRLIAAVERAC